MNRHALNRRRHSQRGLTLMEIMFTVAILTIVMGALAAIALAMGDTARVQTAKINTNDEARRALQVIAPQLRQALRDSINWGDLPGDSISFRIVTDVSGNGYAVDSQGEVEVSPIRTIQRDEDDLNEDGQTLTQLILTEDGDLLRVLANDIVPVSETLAEDGTFGPDEDLNNNGQLDRGFWVEPRDNGLEISVQAQGFSRQGHLITTTLTEFVVPRN